MTPEQDRINLLAARLEVLIKKHELFSSEIAQLKKELNELQAKPTLRFEAEIKPVVTTTPPEVIKVNVNQEPVTVVNYNLESTKKKATNLVNKDEFFESKPSYSAPLTSTKSGLEKFIGENLFSKIGIVITIIGVVIGAKYAIDNQLISPLTRIILGYLVGFGLLAFAIKLKKNYLNFSAVLLSGAMTINYFLTFAAYSYYQLFPQLVTFVIMVTFTVFTVLASLKYDKPIIAHFGLVGAYTVPFLLSDGSGKIAILFSYMTLVNLGILFISLKKYWKSLYFFSFFISWFIYASWFIVRYDNNQHLGLAITFLLIFFALFYATFLLYKLYNKEKYSYSDIVLLLSNSFIFYGIGYVITQTNPATAHLLGLFTLMNALFHFGVGYFISKKELGDKNVFYLIIALVLIFITIAVPVQLEGNLVTLVWSVEAAVLFWIGRTKKVALYEWMSFPIMFIALASIANYWQIHYNQYENSGQLIFLNPVFLTSVLFSASFGFISYINTRYVSAIQMSEVETTLKDVLVIFAPAVFILSLYLSFGLEIINYWNEMKMQANQSLFISTALSSISDVSRFKIVWMIGYTLVFISLMGLFNLYYAKKRMLTYVTLIASLFTLILFLTAGMFSFSSLRENYILSTTSNIGQQLPQFSYLYFRYLSIVLVFGLIWIIKQYIKSDEMGASLKIAFDAVLHGTLLTLASYEIVDGLKYSVLNPQHGLSVLFGSYALLLILMGIFKKNNMHLRYGGIGLFFITLIKLFFVDIVHLNAISKTVVFLLIGILLLIISFLYNKFKHLISDSDDNLST